MMHRFLAIAIVAAYLVPAAAQESASFKVEEYAFNAGGKQGLSSASFQLSLSAIGDSVGRLALSSNSYESEAGFVPAFRPPGEVASLLFTDAQSLEWTPDKSVGTYTLYRGFVSDVEGPQFGACEQSGLMTTGTTDTDEPSTGGGYFYLVTANNRIGEEGSKGSQSDGTPRAGATCP